jgi:hypothetical protein
MEPILKEVNKDIIEDLVIGHNKLTDCIKEISEKFNFTIPELIKKIDESEKTNKILFKHIELLSLLIEEIMRKNNVSEEEYKEMCLVSRAKLKD